MRRRRLGVMVGLLATLLICVIVAAAVGTVYVPFGDVLKMCWNKLSPFNFAPGWRSVDETIILQVRLPRVIGGALVGAALATAGVVFQGLLRNPMADPYIIGTSAGAALGATLAMLLPLSMAFLGPPSPSHRR
jgi:iron complex transport system permease protein